MSETIDPNPAATCPGSDLLLLLAHGADLLDADDAESQGEDPAEATRVAAHVEGCADCAARSRELAAALAAPPPPFDPLELLPAIRARLAEAAAPAAESDALAGAVKLRCTFCRGGLARSTGVYCARCLAPHHGDCFGEHGRCAAPGCDGREVVAARTVVAPKPGRRRPRGLIVLAAAALAGGGGLAALRQSQAPVAPTSRVAPAPPAPATTTESRTQTYDVVDLVTVRASLPAKEETSEREREVQRRLESQQITLNFDATPLSEVVEFLQDITGLNVRLSAGLDGRLPVTLRLRNVVLGRALDEVCAQVGADMEYRDEALTLSSREAMGPAARWSAEWLPSPATEDPDAGRRSPEALLRLLEAELGPGLGGGRVEVAQRTLVVTGSPAVQAATVHLLDRLRLRGLPAELAGAWFLPAATPAGDPWLEKAREHVARLDARKVTLNFPSTPLDEVLAFAQDLGLPAPRVDGPDAGKPVELRVRDLGARSAMLLAARSAGWTLDVDRRGLAFRAPQRPPLELRLREAAQRALAEQPAPEPELPLTYTSGSGTTLDEALGFMRDVTGVNLTLERGVDGGAPASLDVKGVPLGVALDRLLAPLGLGFCRSGAILRIVPRAAASETPERLARLAEALAAPLSAGLDGGSVADLASHVASAAGAEVHLGDGARASRARLRLPAGVTVRQALDLAEHQAGLRWATTWFEGALLVALDAEPAPGPLEAALHLVLRPSPWPGAPAGGARGEAEARAALLEALRGALALDLDRPDEVVERTARALDAVRRARERLEEVHDGLTELRSLQVDEAQVASGEDTVEEVLRRRQEATHGLDRVRRSLSQQAAETERERLERNALVAARVAAQARAESASDPGALPEARRPATAEELERLRVLDEQLRAFDAARDQRARERAREERDLNLEEARLRSMLSQVGTRLDDLRAWPGEGRARREAVARLARGEAWSAVFPRSAFHAWERARRRDAKGRFEAGLAALDLLGVTLDDQLHVEELLEEGPAARAGVPIGAAVVGVRAADAPEETRVAPARLLELGDTLGTLAREGEVRPARVAFGIEGRVVEVQVDVTLETGRR